MPQITPLIAGGIGLLGGSLLGGIMGNNAARSANSALSSQLSVQNAILMQERQRTMAEQQDADTLLRNQQDADLRRLRYGQSTYATIGGGMGQPVTPNQVLGVAD